MQVTAGEYRYPRRALAVLMIVVAASGTARAQAVQALTLRGHEQLLRVYGPPAGAPVIVSSGDGGWLHLGPHVAEWLAARGFFVVGFDAKAYLTAFTTERSTLRPSDVAHDYRSLAAFASAASGRKPILIGVSEGAGLSMLAAADAETKPMIGGVVGLGLTEVNEFGWRWKDSLTYLTHHPPSEPTFRASAIVSGVGPLPLAIVQSTHDEFVARPETQRIFDHASPPKQLWLVDAANHRFSNNLAELDARLLEAIEWVRRNQPR